MPEFNPFSLGQAYGQAENILASQQGREMRGMQMNAMQQEAGRSGARFDNEMLAADQTREMNTAQLKLYEQQQAAQKVYVGIAPILSPSLTDEKVIPMANFILQNEEMREALATAGANPDELERLLGENPTPAQVRETAQFLRGSIATAQGYPQARAPTSTGPG